MTAEVSLLSTDQVLTYILVLYMYSLTVNWLVFLHAVSLFMCAYVYIYILYAHMNKDIKREIRARKR